MTKKLIWIQLPKNQLRATVEVLPSGMEVGLREDDLDPVQHWTWTRLPSAIRTSFDTWRFKNEQDMAVFLLRWS